MTIRITLLSALATLKQATTHDAREHIGLPSGYCSSIFSASVKSGLVRVVASTEIEGRPASIYALTSKGTKYVNANKERVLDEAGIKAWMATQKKPSDPATRINKKKTPSLGNVSPKALKMLDGFSDLIEENQRLRNSLISIRSQLNAVLAEEQEEGVEA